MRDTTHPEPNGWMQRAMESAMRGERLSASDALHWHSGTATCGRGQLDKRSA
ncbi:hypothetical protein KAM448_35190 [Aeromonas caviae]|uniref:Uncharacterized protein n=1 Tax=Aeromonas caviae TaxID=648 RepID=A0ABD0B926_AERCA|nr:hypothetical protein KAM330_47870 [Aeromonas hydrophila]BCR31390.1 hypothetical protein KAM376_43960 [Aeromonas caviae]GJA71841.1 hypothetical protein KAM353_14880 [Aeromonas caviae]GJA81686.1 hypothetical protein KAM355_22460 [Aeromonas caviae]GJB00713.1 hypothetical protein KAM359_41200 [Aeromonas caviae]